MIKSSSDHVLRVDCNTVKLATMVMANSSGNLILSACKRNSFCKCSGNENLETTKNHLFNTKDGLNDFEKQLLRQKEIIKCKNSYDIKENYVLNNNQDDSFVNLNQDSQSSSNLQGLNNQNRNGNNSVNEENNSNVNNNRDDQNNQPNLELFHMPNQLVDINNNIIEPDLMFVDENNNEIGVPNRNLNHNGWNFHNNQLDLNQQPRNQNESNERLYQQHDQNQSNHLCLSLLKDKINCNSNINCINNVSSVQIRQRKKVLLEHDLNNLKLSSQIFPQIDERDILYESDENLNNLRKKSNNSLRRKKSLCKKCIKHSSNQCEHFYSMDCAALDFEQKSFDTKSSFKSNVSLALCSVNDVSNKENSGTSHNIEKDEKTLTLEKKINSPLMSLQCPICLFTLNEPCKPDNCTHNFCTVCVIEWAKISNECPLCRKTFTALLNLKNNQPLDCLIKMPVFDNIDSNYPSFEALVVNEELDWSNMISSFMNERGQIPDNLTEQQHEQLSNFLNFFFGHLGSENMDLEWPF